MKKILLVLAVFASLANATTITININPSLVPDASPPEIGEGIAPAGFGPDSWQNTNVSGSKVNWHARYLGDGDFLSVLFPEKASTMTINDIASISYQTNRATGTAANQDWAAYIYTRVKEGGDASWYGYRFINNYGEHTNIGDWVEYSTDAGMTFRKNSGTTTGYMSFENLKSTYGNELVEMISVQTMTNYADFNGYMDGLVITLTNGDIGRVNFVPEPTTIAILSLGGLLLRRKK
ncbi:MAG: hypothetical protein A2Y10_09460 [Planctomycetes bacterium GWF2_41_51]|nr:MAG: hypothetical protein A2Y10_09460 [Planctomycetes bacterium GWF2_41_51]